jgi:hypothetical protein
MVYSFDPKYWNGTIFLFKEWRMAGDTLELKRNNQPIPASLFPKSLTIERAGAALPDLFHTYRGRIVVSERARVVIEQLAPGQVEFIPVALTAAPTTWLNPLIGAYYSIKDLSRTVRATFGARLPFYPIDLEAVPRITLRLNLASAYYFINVLGRAQRLLWLEMPTQEYPTREDGTVPHSALHDRATWKLRWRTPGEPLIWHDTRWQVENRDYSHHTEIFVEDVLWQELDARFPDQLNAQRVGK